MNADNNPNSLTLPAKLVDAYRFLVSENKVKHDPAQEKVIEKLQNIQNILPNYLPEQEKGLFSRLFSANSDTPKGLYIYGGVGRGKSMLMDLYYRTSPVKKKRRTHFHAFMLEVHQRMHEFRIDNQSLGDPIPHIAKDIAEEAWLFCFDEMHVTDITDAMVIGRLFEHLFSLGVILITTSNRHPDDLYKDGLQREYFLPFIDLLKEHVEIIELASPNDYRLERMQHIKQTYITPSNHDSDILMQQYFDDMAAGADVKPVQLMVQGRELLLPVTSMDILFSSFDDLCVQALGSADYLEIAIEFSTVFLSHIPQMNEENRNEAKRFVTLIDALYEHNVKLICSAAVAPEALYVQGTGSFEFERTISRLQEMQSESYWQKNHLAMDIEAGKEQ